MENKSLADRYAPVALAYDSIMAKMTGSGYMGMMEDYFGPPSARLLEGKARTTQEKRTDID